MRAQTKQHHLSNGLQILGEYHPSHQSAAIGFFVRTGSRDETTKESGVSHFLEHMMFKGTKKRSSLDITYELGNIGAQANAFTSEENTVYYASIVPEYFSQMQELLSDMLRPALDPAEFDMEKKVILEEIALYQDRPQFYLFENAFREYFGTHPAGNSVLGTNASISDLKRDEMMSYFEKRYSPSNIVLVASGNFDWEVFLRDAERHCGAWKDYKCGRELKRLDLKAMRKTYAKKNLNQAHVMLVTEGNSAQDEERYALSVLSSILGDSSGSKFYWELLDTGIAENGGVENDERDGVGVFMGYACTEPDRVERVLEIMKRVLASPLDFSAEELERAKTKLMAKIVLSGELPMGRLMSIGLTWNYRKRIELLSEIIEKIRAVSRESIEQALARYPLKVWSEFRLLPE